MKQVEITYLLGDIPTIDLFYCEGIARLDKAYEFTGCEIVKSQRESTRAYFDDKIIKIEVYELNDEESNSLNEVIK